MNHSFDVGPTNVAACRTDGRSLASVATAVAALAAVVAVVYAIAQYQQGKNDRRQARAAELEAGHARARAERLHEQSLQPYVVATPVPERTYGRDLVLRIQNHGLTAAHDLRVSFPGHRVVVTARRNTYDKGYGAREELVLATTVLAPGQAIIELASILAADGEAEVLTADICVNYCDAQGAELENRYSVTFTEASRMPPDPMTQAVQDIGKTLHSVTSLNDHRSITIETRKAQQQRIFGALPPSPPHPAARPETDAPNEPAG